MKQTLVLFLFLCIMSKTSHSQDVRYYSRDSIIYYHDLSKVENTTTQERLVYINKSIALARSSNQGVLLLKSISRKSFIYSKERDYTNAILVAATLKDEAIALNNRKYRAIAYKKLGLYSKKEGDLIVALGNFQKAYQEFLVLNDSIEMGSALKNVAVIQNDLGVYSDAENSAINALRYLKGNKKADLTWVYNALGRASKEREDYGKSIEWYEKALKVEHDILSRAVIDQNIAVVLIKQGRYEEAITRLFQLTKLPEIKNNKKTYAKIINNMASAKMQLKSPDALNQLMQAYSIRTELADKRELFSSTILLTKYHKKLSPKLALKFAQEAYAIAQQIKSPDAEMESLSYLIALSAAVKSKGYGNRYAYLNDSLASVNNRIRQKYASYEYNLDEAENAEADAIRQSQESNLKAKTAEFKNYIYLSAVIIILLLLLFLVYYYKQRQKKIQLQERYKTESKISKKVHDELANDVFGLRSELEIANVPKNTLKRVDQIYERTRNISKEYKAIDTGSGFFQSLTFMMSGNLTQEVKLILKGSQDINWVKISENTKVALYRSLQELMINVKKHSNASAVIIAFAKASNNTLYVEYKDNGTTLVPELSEGSGLQNVDSRISDLNGSFTFESNKHTGCMATISIPV